jgi:hypothetical protein
MQNVCVSFILRLRSFEFYIYENKLTHVTFFFVNFLHFEEILSGVGWLAGCGENRFINLS